MRRKRPEKWFTNDWVLHHDNTRLHTVYIVHEFLAKNKMAATTNHNTCKSYKQLLQMD
jgi:hypothetical protein